MGQGISLKSERKNPWFKPWFNILLHTQSIVCATHSIRSMFRVLGIYNFGFSQIFFLLLGETMPLSNFQPLTWDSRVTSTLSSRPQRKRPWLSYTARGTTETLSRSPLLVGITSNLSMTQEKDPKASQWKLHIGNEWRRVLAHQHRVGLPIKLFQIF